MKMYFLMKSISKGVPSGLIENESIEPDIQSSMKFPDTYMRLQDFF